ncbi:hypothetical protein PUN28_003670 [Cardiocondyla obscurior]|uniref:Uncharacterized protein n=1 Tax=Cardiocondyla obscurior TaxID=286306 RepID=A0AAW2GMP8_9HYME
MNESDGPTISGAHGTNKKILQICIKNTNGPFTPSFSKSFSTSGVIIPANRAGLSGQSSVLPRHSDQKDESADPSVERIHSSNQLEARGPKLQINTQYEQNNTTPFRGIRTFFRV